MPASGELVEVLRRLEDPLAFLAEVFVHSPLALQIYDKSGRSLLTNPAFRELFGTEPPPEYNVLKDDIAQKNGVLDLIHRAFAGETTRMPVVWYDPRRLEHVRIDEGRRVAIESTFFPLVGSDGQVEHVGIVFKDVTVERTLREEAERERDLLGLVIEQSGDGVIVADANGNLVLFNPAAERQHGVPFKPIGPEHWADTYGLTDVDGKRLEGRDSPLCRAVRGESVEDARWMVRRPDGTKRILVGTAKPLRTADGTPSGAVLVARDETERVQAEADRRAALESAERASRAKDEFLAMLGHELRNPLSPIVTALQLIKMRDGGKPTREHTVIERQVEHLVRLVDDLLDVSRITTGKVELKREKLEIADAVARAIEIASPLLEQRNHRFDVSVPPVGLMVEGDRARLAQIISNLLTNAARYTEPGGSISLTAEREGDDVVISVTDNGIGMSADLVPTVFDLFVQGRRGEGTHGGLGLGLTLVQNLVRMHGGSARAASAGPGKGSTFVVRLPALAEAEPSSVRFPTLPNFRAAASKRVLVVDDNVDAAELLGEVLRAAGHIVSIAHDGPSALAIIGGAVPDVAVLDIGLPVMDGYELARKLQKQLSSSCPPLVALTGYGQEVDRRRSTEAGFFDHLVKPVALDALLACIDRAVK